MHAFLKVKDTNQSYAVHVRLLTKRSCQYMSYRNEGLTDLSDGAEHSLLILNSVHVISVLSHITNLLAAGRD